MALDSTGDFSNPYQSAMRQYFEVALDPFGLGLAMIPILDF